MDCAVAKNLEQMITTTLWSVPRWPVQCWWSQINVVGWGLTDGNGWRQCMCSQNFSNPGKLLYFPCQLKRTNTRLCAAGTTGTDAFERMKNEMTGPCGELYYS